MRVEWLEVRCPSCRRLLFKVFGLALVETVCPRCGTKSEWPTLSPAIVLSRKTDITVEVSDELYISSP